MPTALQLPVGHDSRLEDVLFSLREEEAMVVAACSDAEQVPYRSYVLDAWRRQSTELVDV